METTSLLDDLIDGFRDIGLVGNVGLDCMKLAWVLFRDGLEFVASLADVDGVDCGCIVGEAAVCNSEADATIR